MTTNAKTRNGILRGIVFPGHRPLYLYAADTFHRICNPMVLNMRIYNPEKHSAFTSHQRETRRGKQRGTCFPGSQTLIFICGGYVPSDLQSDGAKYKDLQSGKTFRFHKPSTRNTRRHTKRNLFSPGHRPLYLHPADTFHRICNPMVLNMRIYNPEKHSAFISRQRETRDGKQKRTCFSRVTDPDIYMRRIANPPKRTPKRTPPKRAETEAETARNDRHGKHTLSQVGNPVPRSIGQYFAGSTRVLAAEYSSVLRKVRFYSYQHTFSSYRSKSSVSCAPASRKASRTTSCSCGERRMSPLRRS